MITQQKHYGYLKWACSLPDEFYFIFFVELDDVFFFDIIDLCHQTSAILLCDLTSFYITIETPASIFSIWPY